MKRLPPLICLVLLLQPSTLAEKTKLVVLGFDGADAQLTQQWMDDGSLPNLAKLREQGDFKPLRSTVPSQTPVSWSTFATGLNPGRHQIFDFLKRDPKTYRPGFAAFEETRKPFLFGKRNGLYLGLITGLLIFFVIFLMIRRLGFRAVVIALVPAIIAGMLSGRAAARLLPHEQPVAINRQHGATFWEQLGAAGHRAQVVRVPVTFPPEPFPHGKLLSGLGTPDLSFRIGKPFYFTSELFFEPNTGGDFSVEIVELDDNKGRLETTIKGPPNKLFPGKDPYLTLPMTLTLAENREQLTIEVAENRIVLKEGEWSDWVPFTFAFNSLIQLNGIGRFRVLELKNEVRLYLSPIMFDPEKLPPLLKLTAPSGYIDELTGSFGRFKTIGWAIDTWSLAEGTIDEQVFLEDVGFTADRYRDMLLGSLKKQDWDTTVFYFEFTDRVQHMMWRFFDPKHPLYDAEKAAHWGSAIPEAYQRMDRIVGEVMEALPEDTVLMVLSDHGFSSFRRTMNYNTWLAKNGYMHLKGEYSDRRNLEHLFDQGDFFVNVDWSRTRAYALGLGQIYINLKGREGQGIVTRGEEYDRLVEELRAGLLAHVDEQTGDHPVAHVWIRDDVYQDYDPELIPDLIPSNSEGYRVGWQDSLGGIARAVNEDNDRLWSGDHCSVYPPLVDGILFCNRKLADRPAGMIDIMPTIMDLLEVTPDGHLDGKSLWIQTQ